MLLRALKIDGLAGDDLDLDGLDRASALPGGADAGRVADALELLAAALTPARGPDALARLGWGAAEVVDNQYTLTDPAAARNMVDSRAHPRVRVEAAIELDPPLYGRLRERAMRDPQIALALAEGSELRVRVGWLFNPDCTTVAASLLGVAIGEVGFPIGNEQPEWLAPLLEVMGDRLLRLDWGSGASGAIERIAAAAWSADPDLRSRAQRALDALSAEPFGWGPLGLIAGDSVSAGVGDALRPLRWYGPTAVLAVQLVEAVFLRAPDVLLVEVLLDDAVGAWLDAQTEAEDAMVEQILRVGR